MVDVDHESGLADHPFPACSTKFLDLLLKKPSNLQHSCLQFNLYLHQTGWEYFRCVKRSLPPAQVDSGDFALFWI